MARRIKYSGILDADAECQDCSWVTYSRKNALANGAQHCDRTGHRVVCQQIVGVTYMPEDHPYHLARVAGVDHA